MLISCLTAVLDTKVDLLLLSQYHIRLRKLEADYDLLGVSYERQRALSSAAYIGCAVIPRDTSEGYRAKPDSLSRLRQNLQNQLRDGETQRYNAPRNKRTRVKMSRLAIYIPAKWEQYLKRHVLKS